MPFENDYIMRRVQEMAAIVARLMKLAFGGQVALALEELQTSRQRLLPIDPSLVDSVDPASAIGLLGDPQHGRLYARLLVLEADLREQAGETARVAELLRRAVDVHRHAAALGGPPDGEADLLIAGVRERLARG